MTNSKEQSGESFATFCTVEMYVMMIPTGLYSKSLNLLAVICSRQERGVPFVLIPRRVPTTDCSLSLPRVALPSCAF